MHLGIWGPDQGHIPEKELALLLVNVLFAQDVKLSLPLCNSSALNDIEQSWLQQRPVVA